MVRTQRHLCNIFGIKIQGKKTPFCTPSEINNPKGEGTKPKTGIGVLPPWPFGKPPSSNRDDVVAAVVMFIHFLANAVMTSCCVLSTVLGTRGSSGNETSLHSWASVHCRIISSLPSSFPFSLWSFHCICFLLFLFVFDFIRPFHLVLCPQWVQCNGFIKEGTWCHERWMLCATDESLISSSETGNTLYVDELKLNINK